MKNDLFKDIFKCGKVAFIITLTVSVFFGIIFLLSSPYDSMSLLNFIKNGLYYIGLLSLLLSSGFLIKRNSTRSLNYNEKWGQIFRTLNIGRVLMLISLFICLYGVLIQLFIKVKY